MHNRACLSQFLDLEVMIPHTFLIEAVTLEIWTGTPPASNVLVIT